MCSMRVPLLEVIGAVLRAYGLAASSNAGAWTRALFDGSTLSLHCFIVFMMLIAWESSYLSPDEELLKAALMSRVLVAVSSSTDLDAAVLLVGETRI